MEVGRSPCSRPAGRFGSTASWTTPFTACVPYDTVTARVWRENQHVSPWFRTALPRNLTLSLRARIAPQWPYGQRCRPAEAPGLSLGRYQVRDRTQTSTAWIQSRPCSGWPRKVLAGVALLSVTALVAFQGMGFAFADDTSGGTTTTTTSPPPDPTTTTTPPTTTTSPPTTDTTPPSVTVEQAGDQPDPTYSPALHYVIKFSEDVNDFKAEDLVVAGTADPTVMTLIGGPRTITQPCSPTLTERSTPPCPGVRARRRRQCERRVDKRRRQRSVDRYIPGPRVPDRCLGLRAWFNDHVRGIGVGARRDSDDRDPTATSRTRTTARTTRLRTS